MITIGRYRHYKGGLYRVLFDATHSETGEALVVYQSLDDARIWVRPKDMFFEKVDYLGEELPRFKHIGE